MVHSCGETDKNEPIPANVTLWSGKQFLRFIDSEDLLCGHFRKVIETSVNVLEQEIQRSIEYLASKEGNGEATKSCEFDQCEPDHKCEECSAEDFGSFAHMRYLENLAWCGGQKHTCSSSSKIGQIFLCASPARLSANLGVPFRIAQLISRRLRRPRGLAKGTKLPTNVCTWSPDFVSAWMASRGLDHLCEQVVSQSINGQTLFRMGRTSNAAAVFDGVPDAAPLCSPFAVIVKSVMEGLGKGKENTNGEGQVGRSNEVVDITGVKDNKDDDFNNKSINSSSNSNEDITSVKDNNSKDDDINNNNSINNNSSNNNNSSSSSSNNEDNITTVNTLASSSSSSSSASSSNDSSISSSSNTNNNNKDNKASDDISSSSSSSLCNKSIADSPQPTFEDSPVKIVSIFSSSCSDRSLSTTTTTPLLQDRPSPTDDHRDSGDGKSPVPVRFGEQSIIARESWLVPTTNTNSPLTVPLPLDGGEPPVPAVDVRECWLVSTNNNNTSPPLTVHLPEESLDRVQSVPVVYADEEKRGVASSPPQDGEKNTGDIPLTGMYGKAPWDMSPSDNNKTSSDQPVTDLRMYMGIQTPWAALLSSASGSAVTECSSPSAWSDSTTFQSSSSSSSSARDTTSLPPPLHDTCTTTTTSSYSQQSASWSVLMSSEDSSVTDVSSVSNGNALLDPSAAATTAAVSNNGCTQSSTLLHAAAVFHSETCAFCELRPFVFINNNSSIQPPCPLHPSSLEQDQDQEEEGSPHHVLLSPRRPPPSHLGAFSVLPTELVLRIFSLLNPRDRMCVLPLICRKFRKWVYDASLWETVEAASVETEAVKGCCTSDADGEEGEGEVLPPRSQKHLVTLLRRLGPPGQVRRLVITPLLKTSGSKTTPQLSPLLSSLTSLEVRSPSSNVQPSKPFRRFLASLLASPLPSLSSLSILSPVPFVLDVDSTKLPSAVPRLQSLAVAQVDGKTIRDLTAYQSHLTSLSIKLDDIPPWFDPPGLVPYIVEHCPALKELSIRRQTWFISDDLHSYMNDITTISVLQNLNLLDVSLIHPPPYLILSLAQCIRSLTVACFDDGGIRSPLVIMNCPILEELSIEVFDRVAQSRQSATIGRDCPRLRNVRLSLMGDGDLFVRDLPALQSLVLVDNYSRSLDEVDAQDVHLSVEDTPALTSLETLGYVTSFQDILNSCPKLVSLRMVQYKNQCVTPPKCRVGTVAPGSSSGSTLPLISSKTITSLDVLRTFHLFNIDMPHLVKAYINFWVPWRGELFRPSTRSSLTSLTVCGWSPILPRSPEAWFPKLKSLHISHVTRDDAVTDDRLDRFLNSNFPRLEELSFSHCDSLIVPTFSPPPCIKRIVFQHCESLFSPIIHNASHVREVIFDHTNTVFPRIVGPAICRIVFPTCTNIICRCRKVFCIDEDPHCPLRGLPGKEWIAGDPSTHPC